MSNDHYVPQFYLRNFSPGRSDGAPGQLKRRSIHLINIPRLKFVPHAGIKGECKKAGFHDYKLGVEAALSQLEDLAAPAIRNLVDSGIPPPPRSNDHEVLATFIAIQRSRTLCTAEVADKMADRMFKVAYETDPRLGGLEFSNFEIRSDYPVAIPLKVAAQFVPQIATQLAVHVFVNATPTDFITSDNPVVAHNQYCEGVDYIGVLGWNCSGIQIFFPVSSRHLIFLYDSGVYAVGGALTSRITSIKDIEALNELQILAARENIYFGNREMADSLLVQVKRLASQLRRKRQVTSLSTRIPNGEGTSELVHQHERLLPIKLALTSIRIKRNPRRVPLNRRASMVRGRAQLSTRHPLASSRVYRADQFYLD